MTEGSDPARVLGGPAADWQVDNARNREFYQALIAEYGVSFRSLNWRSVAGQRVRFAVLCGIGMAHNASVLDVGCGTGDLCVFLRERGFTGRYIGVDITSEMVEAARARGIDGEFYVTDVLPSGANGLKALRCDYVLSSGIFYYRQKAPQLFLEAMSRRFLDLARVGVAFNSLSTWADQASTAESSGPIP